MTWQISLTIFINIVGWGIVHILSSQRDKNKEWREFARNTAKLVEEIEEKAIRYHTNEHRNIALEFELKKDIDKLDTYVTLIKKHLRMSHSISFLRSSITLNNFQSHAFLQQDCDSKLVRDLSFHAATIREALYLAE